MAHTHTRAQKNHFQSFKIALRLPLSASSYFSVCIVQVAGLVHHLCTAWIRVVNLISIVSHAVQWFELFRVLFL